MRIGVSQGPQRIVFSLKQGQYGIRATSTLALAKGARVRAIFRLNSALALLFAALSTNAFAEGPISASGFEVSGNTLLPPEAIQARLAEYQGDTSLARLKAAAAAVQELYRRAGYGGVVAFLPEQTAQDGVVRIRVVEGRLARIEVSGNDHFSTENILASLPDLRAGQTPNVRLIDQQIQMANESPVKTVQVLLQPGQAPGAIDARLTVAERPTQRFNLRLDNTGNASTGRWRSAIGWLDGDFMGHDQVVGLELQLAPEHPSDLVVASASYRRPIYARSMAFDAYFAWYDVTAGTTATAAGNLDFAGRGHVLGLRLSSFLPRQGNIDQRLVFGVEDRVYDNTCSIEGLPPGACGSAGAGVEVQPLSVQYLGQSAGRITQNWALGLSANLAAVGSRSDAASIQAVRAGARLHYGILRASYGGAMTFSDSTGRGNLGSISFRAAMQFSGDALIPGEQFGLGGAQNVRGYAEREVSGDRGLQATLEYLSPALSQLLAAAEPSPAASPWQLRGVLFAEGGWVQNRLDLACAPGRTICRLSSLGAGLRLSRKDLQARLDWGHALRAGSTTRRGDNRLHFAISLAI